MFATSEQTFIFAFSINQGSLQYTLRYYYVGSQIQVGYNYSKVNFTT